MKNSSVISASRKQARKATKIRPERKASSRSGARPHHARFIVAPVPAGSGRSAKPSRTSGKLRQVRFGYFNPEARAVHVVGTFNGWDPSAMPLVRDNLGGWAGEIDLPPGEHRYRFVVDGEWRDDPTAAQTIRNPYGGFDAVMVVLPP